MQVYPHENAQQVAASFAKDFFDWNSKAEGRTNTALSGGSTPKLLFAHWANLVEKNREIWDSQHFFWGDERCVPPDHAESNFGVTKALFFEPAEIPESNIHRVVGESDPEKEAKRYAELIASSLRQANGLPQFDVVMLGLGSDGHTASIFPDQMELIDDSRICAVATHPGTGQQRITLTGPVIANAKRIAFLITGSSKKDIFSAIASRSADAQRYPAARFMHLPNTVVYIDSAVAG